jgi:hypothetical protein
VYVDLEVLSTGGGASRPVDASAANVAAVRSLDHLVDAGHELVLVADPPIAPGAVTGIPGGLTETAVTAVPVEHGTGRLVPHVRRGPLPSPLGPAPTILVGRSPAPGAIHRCDSLARDVRAAVLEILAVEAMPAG